MQKRLHRFTAAIIWKEGEQKGKGTGFLVSNDLILTVAHNFFDTAGIRIKKESISIYPGAFGELKDAYTVEKVYIPEEYYAANKKSYKFDYALIKLDKKVEMGDFLTLSYSFNNL